MSSLSPPTRSALTLALFVAVSSAACSRESEAAAKAYDGEGRIFTLLARDEAALTGLLPASSKKIFRYTIPGALPVPQRGALEIEYETRGGNAPGLFVFSAEGEGAWALPLDGAFLDPSLGGNIATVRYRIPLRGRSLAGFELSFKMKEDNGKSPGLSVTGISGSGITGSEAAIVLRSVRIAPQAWGYERRGEALWLTPFVFREDADGLVRVSVAPGKDYAVEKGIRLRARLGSARSRLRLGDSEFRFSGAPAAQADFEQTVPDSALKPGESFFPVAIEGPAFPPSFIVETAPTPIFPKEPVPSDPGIILARSRSSWRDPRYEVFGWERFPSILIFDTADYAMQDRLFKRLAFFTEKAGFRGKLSTDAQIAGFHGWNAHDYRASDLAAFFELARKTDFPLNREERELEGILRANGIIAPREGSSSIVAGTGAVVSISRESEDYLRSLFMTHECYHGLFFADGDFRAFAAKRWANLDEPLKTFLVAYFDSRRYDTEDDFLMSNELMAYCLQQGLAAAGAYFGKNLPSRLESDPRRRIALPAKDAATESWPLLAAGFEAETAAFDAYVRARWGLRAGNLATIYQISRTNAAR